MNSRVESRFIAYSGRIAWSLCLISLVFALLALLLLATSVNVDVGSAWSGRGALLFFIVFSIVGGLIVAHQPRQMIGWIFCWTGLINEFMGFAKEYAIYTLLARPNLFPGGVIMAWLRDWLWIPGTVAPIIFVPLLFPTGHLPARGWRPMVWVTMIALSLSAFAAALKPGKLGEFSFVDNPFGINGTGEISEFILLAGLLISIGTLVGAVLSLLLRLRNSAGQERKQLQWLVFAALLLPPAFFVGIIFPTIGAPVLLGAIQILPISVGIAILRYRLWDIDIIIRRTLIYGALTAALVLIYFSAVVVLQQIFRGVSGQASDLTIILSTLAIAALFNPLRGRVQNAIDRAFYRRKYDAARVIAQFAQSARDEVELSMLSEKLVGVVNETMQPTSVSLWLRK